MDDHYGATPEYYPQVKFDFDQDPDPNRRRAKNIKKAFKLLKPTKTWYSVWPFNIVRFNSAGVCCVTGVRLAALGPDAYNKPLLDPDTLKPLESGTTLAQHFFKDQLTGHDSHFTAYSNVSSGIPLRSSYCPELLQLMWLYTQWRQQQQLDNQGQMSVWLWKRRKIKMVPITDKPKKSEPKPGLVVALEPFFQMCLENQGKGIEINEYKNPLTGEVDLTSIHLDLRVMRAAEQISSEAQPSSVEPLSVSQSGV
tara:strand:+ start:9144 stop:9902 length:759 start_codon:yes stop_codon:yes gene_type:complete